MYQAIIIVHVLLGLGVIGLILLQHGKGADAGAAFGSASSGSVFGAQGASSFLSRTTAILAALFFSTSLGLAVLSGYQGDGSTDLMDTPDTEEVFTDLPSIKDNDSNAPIKAIPMKNDGDVPTTSIVPEGISNSVDKAAKGVNTAIDSVENKAETAIDNAKEGISNVGGTVKDGVDSVENTAETVIENSKTIGSEKLDEAEKNK